MKLLNYIVLLCVIFSTELFGQNYVEFDQLNNMTFDSSTGVLQSLKTYSCGARSSNFLPAHSHGKISYTFSDESRNSIRFGFSLEDAPLSEYSTVGSGFRVYGTKLYIIHKGKSMGTSEVLKQGDTLEVEIINSEILYYINGALLAEYEMDSSVDYYVSAHILVNGQTISGLTYDFPTSLERVTFSELNQIDYNPTTGVLTSLSSSNSSSVNAIGDKYIKKGENGILEYTIQDVSSYALFGLTDVAFDYDLTTGNSWSLLNEVRCYKWRSSLFLLTPSGFRNFSSVELTPGHVLKMELIDGSFRFYVDDQFLLEEVLNWNYDYLRPAAAIYSASATLGEFRSNFIHDTPNEISFPISSFYLLSTKGNPDPVEVQDDNLTFSFISKQLISSGLDFKVYDKRRFNKSPIVSLDHTDVRVGRNFYEADVSQLSAGMYYLEVTQNEETLRLKFEVQ